MNRLNTEDWGALVQHLSYADTTSLELASAACRPLVHRARLRWARLAMLEASLVTVAHVIPHEHADSVRCTLTSTPVPDGYVLSDGTNTVHVSRRMYVHDFPRLCCLLVGSPYKLRRIE